MRWISPHVAGGNLFGSPPQLAVGLPPECGGSTLAALLGSGWRASDSPDDLISPDHDG